MIIRKSVITHIPDSIKFTEKLFVEEPEALKKQGGVKTQALAKLRHIRFEGCWQQLDNDTADNNEEQQ